MSMSTNKILYVFEQGRPHRISRTVHKHIDGWKPTSQLQRNVLRCFFNASTMQESYMHCNVVFEDVSLASVHLVPYTGWHAGFPQTE